MTTEKALPRKRKYTRVTLSEWAEIEALWQAGEVTLAELSERFGPSPRALQNHFSKASITKGEKAAAMAAAVREEILKEELNDKDLLVQRAKSIRERAFQNANIVEDLIMGQLALAQRDPSQILKAGAALKMLSLAAGSLERLHDLRQRALGLDKDNVFAEEMPELVIRCLTDEEVAEMRQQQESEDELAGLTLEPEAAPASGGAIHATEDDDVVVEDGESEPDKSRQAQTPPPVDAAGYRLVRGAQP